MHVRVLWYVLCVCLIKLPEMVHSLDGTDREMPRMMRSLNRMR